MHLQTWVHTHGAPVFSCQRTLNEHIPRFRGLQSPMLGTPEERRGALKSGLALEGSGTRFASQAHRFVSSVTSGVT